MPEENELKFVLRMDPSLENWFAAKATEVYHIDQAYLFSGKGLTVRIRRQRDRRGRVRYVHTTKQRVGTKLIEVEKRISRADYEELLGVSDGRLSKVRYELKGWEIDFFKRGGATYFVMAEKELPPGVAAPRRVPKFVSRNLVLAVPKEDCRFSSKKLTSPEYARKVYAAADHDARLAGNKTATVVVNE